MLTKSIIRIFILVACVAIHGTMNTKAAIFNFPSTDTPLALPDLATVVSTINVTGADNQAITDVNVTVDITHTFAGDLSLTLTDVNNGVSVLLFDQNDGGTEEDITDVTFDDEAATSISDELPPFGPGTFQPESGNFLSSFNGNSFNDGNWTLTIVDNLGGDSGTLNSWSLNVATVPEPQTYVMFATLLLTAGFVGIRNRKKRNESGVINVDSKV